MEFKCKIPRGKSAQIIKRDFNVISHSLTREYSVVFEKANGCYLYDTDKKKYLDFAAGVAVAAVGHTNPFVVKAIQDQMKKFIHAEFSDFHVEIPVSFVELLLTFVPRHLNNAFLSNSGTESIEAAYKLSRWHSQKKYCIAFKPCFHGRTMGSLSLTNAKPVQRERFGPFLPVKHAPYPYFYKMGMDEKACASYCLDKLEKILKSLNGDIAAVFMEPIAGEPGYVVPPKEWVAGVRKLCNTYGALLVSDEIQAGYNRTGKFLAIEHFDVKSDIVCLAKAVGGGIPMGVTLANKKIMDWTAGSHANTFGGNLLACAAGIASLKFMRKKQLGKNASRVGGHMIKRLNEMKERCEIIGDVRGKGLMIGVEFTKSKKPAAKERNAFLCKCLDEKLIMLPAGESVVRICPPLILTKKQAERGMDIFEDAVKVLQK